MKTKAQLVEEILSIETVDTKANLMKLSLAKLESLLSDLENKMVTESEQPVETTTTAPVPSQTDMQAMMEMMKRELMEELKEQARKEVEAEQATSAKTNTISKRREIDRNEMIPIMNVTNGTLIYASRKTGTELQFSEYGDIEYVDYQELLTMKSGQRRFFDEPFILVMDDDVVDALGLTKMYSNMKNPDQIDKIFNMNQREFEDVVEKSPKGIKHLIVSRARKLYDQGELDSVRKINYINERFQTDIGQRG